MRLQVLFALAYGHRGSDGRGGYVPGLSNEVMALVIKDQGQRFYHVSVQQEIGTAMRSLGVEADFEVLYGGQRYLTTEQVLDAMLEDLRQEGVNPKDCDIHVLCHSIHWSGCKWILQARGIKPRKAMFASVTDGVRVWHKVPYDHASAQFQGRGPLNAWLYKFWAGVKKLLKGEIPIFGPKAQRGTTMPTIPDPTPVRIPVWKKVIGTFAALILVVVVSFGAYTFVREMDSQTDVNVGQTYQILIYSCNQEYDKGDGSATTERMYDVVFVSTNPRDMRRQLILPAFTVKDENIPPGQGGWMEVDRGTIEGIYYGRYTEFRYNGTLQPASVVPICRQ